MGDVNRGCAHPELPELELDPHLVLQSRIEVRAPETFLVPAS
jgi:hypothetical protein